MKFLAILILALWGPLIFAGNEMGNGGDAVLCKNGVPGFGGAKAVLLDYYEAQANIGPINIKPINAPMEEMVRFLLHRLAQKDPNRAANYAQEANSFFSSARWLKGIELTDITDSQQVSLPKDCEIHQLVIQKQPEYPWEKLYTINQDIYEMLPKSHQAGMVLHEIIYKESKKTQSNSISTRAFNSLLATKSFESLNTISYLDYLTRYAKLTELPHTVDGNDYKLGSVEFYQNGKIKKGFAINNLTFQISKICSAVTNNWMIEGNTMVPFVPGVVEYYENGSLAKSSLGALSAFLIDESECFQFVVLPQLTNKNVEFYQNFVPKRLDLYSGSKAERLTTYNDQQKCFDGTVYFHQTGRVKSGHFIATDLSSGQACARITDHKELLMTDKGELLPFSSQTLNFDEQGRVITQH